MKERLPSQATISMEEVDRVQALHEAAVKRTCKGWVLATKREDGSAQIYAPSRGPCRVVVPIAETETENGRALVACFNAFPAMAAAVREGERWRDEKPIDMLITCPACDRVHLDIGEFRDRTHRKHLCENTPDGPGTGCGHLWVPHQYATRGVALEELRDRQKVDQLLIQALDDIVQYLSGSAILNGNEQMRVEALLRRRARCIYALTTSDYAFALTEKP